MKTSVWKATLVVGLVLFSCACSGGPKGSHSVIDNHLARYERLIEEFEPKFEEVRNDPAELAKVSERYRKKSEAWMTELTSMAPDLTDDERESIRAGMDELNRRAQKMLTGS